MITITLDNSSGIYQASINGGAAKSGGATPAKCLRALAETLDGEDAKAAAVAAIVAEAATQETALKGA